MKKIEEMLKKVKQSFGSVWSGQEKSGVRNANCWNSFYSNWNVSSQDYNKFN